MRKDKISKKIVIEGKNGTHNINLSRQETNRSNLEEDRKIWQMLTTENLEIKKSYNNKNKIIWECKNTNLDKLTKNEVSKIANTIFSRISKNASFRGFRSVEDIKIDDIKIMAQKYLDLDPWLQIDYCRDSTRQSIDEYVQVEMIRQFTNLDIQKPPNGKYVLANGEIQSKKSLQESKNARSIDVLIPSLKAYGFLKYSGPVGSVTSVHQVNESKDFIREAKLFCDKYEDEKMFFVQVDGDAGEEHIPEMLELIGEHSNYIFTGNSEQTIDWLNDKKVKDCQLAENAMAVN